MKYCIEFIDASGQKRALDTISPASNFPILDLSLQEDVQLISLDSDAWTQLFSELRMQWLTFFYKRYEYRKIYRKIEELAVDSSKLFFVFVKKVACHELRVLEATAWSWGDEHDEVDDPKYDKKDLAFVADDGEISTIDDVNSVSDMALVRILKNGSIVHVSLATLTRLAALELDQLDAEVLEKMFAPLAELWMSWIACDLCGSPTPSVQQMGKLNDLVSELKWRIVYEANVL